MKNIIEYVGFQSLSGFLRPCDFFVMCQTSCFTNVSIPVGFSKALRRRLASHVKLNEELFQSLSGFLRPCDGPWPS